jgi:CubicO group peptidase (beta-lactamase class C family)
VPDFAPYGFGPHASPRAFGHSGSQSSIGMADPEHGLVVALVFNGQAGEQRHDKRVRAVLGSLYEELNIAG